MENKGLIIVSPKQNDLILTRKTCKFQLHRKQGEPILLHQSILKQVLIDPLQMRRIHINFYNIQKIKEIEKKMKLMKKLKSLLEEGDFFHSTQLLRYRGESEYKTMTGGILSIGIIITMIIGFSSMIISTLNLSTITYTQRVTKRENPTQTKMKASPDQNYMFGIQIHHVDLNAYKRYFDIIGWYHIGKFGKYQKFDVPLVPCTKEHWASLPEVVNKFDSLDMRWWLCPQIGYELNIQGKYSSDISQEYIFQVNPCDNATDPLRPCASQQQIDQLFADYGNGLYFFFYFINTIINPDQVDYKTYYLEDNQGVIIGKNGAVEASLYVTDYTISTDYSIFPFSDINVDSGFIVQDTVIKNNYAVPDQSPFAYFFIGKSSRSIQYQRQVQKISTVFSFIGGLVGAIISVMFVINSYTSFSYELSVALEVFGQPEMNTAQQSHEGQQICTQQKRKDVSLFDFVKHQMFYLFKFCQKKPQWSQVNHIAACRQEILQQLDVKTIIKRLVFLEYSLTHLFEDEELEDLQNKKPKTVDEIRKIRQKVSMVHHKDQSSSDSSNIALSKQNKKKSESKLSKILETDENLQNCLPKYNMDGQIQIQISNNLNVPLDGYLDDNIMRKKIRKSSHILKVQILGDERHSTKNMGANNPNLLFERRNSNLTLLKSSIQKPDLIHQRNWSDLSADMKPVDLQNRIEGEIEIPVEWNDNQ